MADDIEEEGDDEEGWKIPSKPGSTPEQRDLFLQSQMPIKGGELADIIEESDPEAVADELEAAQEDAVTASEDALVQSFFNPPEDIPAAAEVVPTPAQPNDTFSQPEVPIPEESSFEADPGEFAAAFEDYLQANPDEELPGGVGPQDETFIPGMPGSEFNDEKFPVGDGLDVRASAEADYRSSQQERSAAELAIFRLLAQDNREHTRQLHEILTFLERDRI